MATIEELLAYGKQQLEQSGNEYAKYERKVLLEEVLKCNYLYMLMHGDEAVDAEEEQRYYDMIKKRCQHYPLQYLTGTAHFMDYTFLVNENVLIPRNDTEILVEHADGILTEILNNGKEKVSVLDLCCGSGCIGISLKLYHREIELVLSDLSQKALDVAEKNLDNYNLHADVLCGDLFEPVEGKHFDMIVCNPPYIEQEVIATLMPEVRDYEPVTALDGGKDGLLFYRRIIPKATDYLKKEGYLMFEIGYHQGKDVTFFMEQAGFLDVSVKKDYAGHDRVVFGHL